MHLWFSGVVWKNHLDSCFLVSEFFFSDLLLTTCLRCLRLLLQCLQKVVDENMLNLIQTSLKWLVGTCTLLALWQLCLRRPAQDTQEGRAGPWRWDLSEVRPGYQSGFNKIHGHAEAVLGQSWRQRHLQHSSDRDWTEMVSFGPWSRGFSPVMHFQIVKEQLLKSFSAVITTTSFFREFGVSCQVGIIVSGWLEFHLWLPNVASFPC